MSTTTATRAPLLRVRFVAALLVVVSAALLWSSGCAPWYRDQEIRALEARDYERLEQLVAEGDAHLAAKRFDPAQAKYLAAAELNARYLPALYGLVRLFDAQQRDAEALAAARFALTSEGSDPAIEAKLRDFLVAHFAEDELYVLALDSAFGAAGAPDISTVAATPALALVYGKLAEAHQLARGGKHAEALERYAEWLSEYGVPDHKWLHKWSDEVLQETAKLVEPRLELAEQELSSGNAEAAAIAYGIAYRYLPAATIEEKMRSRLVRVAADLSNPAALSPIAAKLCAAGSAAAQAGRMGAALAAYRQAVAAAPYWALPRHNLALILASVQLYDEAAIQMNWHLALAPTAPHAQKARARLQEWKDQAAATP